MSRVATRLLSLVLMLQSRPIWKASELAEEFGVSQRTVHRDLRALEGMGIPIHSERGLYGGFSLVRGYRLPPLLFTAEEAAVLCMGAQLVRELWGQTYTDAALAATAKLDAVLPDDLRGEVARARESLIVGGLTALDYRVWGATIHTLRHCIGERRSVEITYRGFRRGETCRVVDPYALTLQWGYWYLVGMCHLRGSLRTFRVDRSERASPSEDGFVMPSGFDVREYLRRSMRFEPEFEVVVRVAAFAAPEVKERHGHWMRLSEQEDGSVMARSEAAPLDWAAGWVLSTGPAARALAPPELIARVREAAAAVLRSHAEPAPLSGSA